MKTLTLKELTRRAILAMTVLAAVVPARAATPREVTAMEPDRFWAIIDGTTSFEADPERQLKALDKALGRLSLDDIQRFELAFDAALRRSYNWDLWAADYVAHGGASDDSFEYFRCWLISKGRVTFEHVLGDPDSLADILAPDLHGVLEFEDFAYVAREAWSRKARPPGQEMPNAASMIHVGVEPSGTPFTEGDDAALALRLPRLWKRFGGKPLGFE